MKSAGLRIRVEPSLRELFVSICRANDLTAAQVIRAFMRDYVENNKESVQGNLFEYANYFIQSSNNKAGEE